MPPRRKSSGLENDNDPDEMFENIARRQMNKNMNNKNPIKLVVTGILLLITLVISILAVKVVTIEGNQLGVLETWTGGVSTNILQPKTYFLFPGWSQSVFKYDASSQVFVMNDKPMADERTASGREKDAYLVQSAEGQDMRISLNLRYRIDPAKLVYIHTTVRKEIDEKIVRGIVMRVVKDEATKKKAIDAYSGEGLVKLQSDIQTALAGAGEGKELAERGILVENFVIEHIELDPKYIEEIKGKQIATQKALRAKEEQIAAEAEALVAKSKAQADFNTQLVKQLLTATNMVIQAQADNERVIIAAKAAAEQATVAAKAEQTKLTLVAEGKKASMIAEAEGTLAMGKAEAAAKELMLKAYDVKGADAWVKVEVSKNLGAAFGNIKGYLPEKMTINTFTDNFMKGLDVSTGNVIAGPPALKN